MPNTAASTLPALRRNVTGYLQARRNGPHAVAKPARARQPEARAHMPVVVLGTRRAPAPRRARCPNCVQGKAARQAEIASPPWERGLAGDALPGRLTATVCIVSTQLGPGRPRAPRLASQHRGARPCPRKPTDPSRSSAPAPSRLLCGGTKCRTATGLLSATRSASRSGSSETASGTTRITTSRRTFRGSGSWEEHGLVLASRCASPLLWPQVAIDSRAPHATSAASA